ncbi:phosphoglucosamine mutase [bacterium]|nr:phosphoglucosamine mutase [bacterium]
MNKLFGTDGIREIFYSFPLDLDGLVKLGKTVNTVIIENKMNRKIVLGGDTRGSTRVIIDLLSSVFSYAGMEVYDLGVCPTPGVAYVAKNLECSIGIVVSASHNPYYYNGIKFFLSDGMKLSVDIENKLEKIFKTENFIKINRDNVSPGVIHRTTEIFKDYVVHVKNLFNNKKIGKKVVIDSANGAAYGCAPDIFDNIFESVEYINASPDGVNINEDCGSTNISALIEQVRERKADWGIAFDGDSDRVMIVDDEGFIFDGDYILSVLALFMKKSNTLANNAVTATVMSNLGMENFLKEEGITLRRSPVGDKYVLEKMLENGDVIGGEQSGHIILLEDSTTGDGLISAVRFFNVLSQDPEIVAKVKGNLKKYPQVLINVKIKTGKKEIVMHDVEVIKHLENAEKTLGKRGRILLRPSGTEHLFRVMTEGSDRNLITTVAEEVSEYIKDNYGE